MNKATIGGFGKYVRTNKTKAFGMCAKRPIPYWKDRYKRYGIAVEVFEEYMSRAGK